jgi:hypothetical protein
MRELEEALRRVKPGGMLIVSTGDMDAWTWRWAPTQHWYLETPQHVSFASRRFFRWFSAHASVAIERLARIPHQRGGWRDRLDEAVNVLYFGSVGRGQTGRMLRGALRRLPPWRGLVHKTAMVTASHLRDHVVIIMRKRAEPEAGLGVVAAERAVG